MTAPARRQLLICSIGNPPPLHHTRHSAGHILLYHLPSLLHPTPTTFHTDRSYYPSGLVCRDPTPENLYTLFHSPTYMNISGKAIASAWKTFQREYFSGLGQAQREQRATLVVLHDEMEKGFGQVKLKRTGSAGGHNGITSCIECLGTKDFVRIGIGIGRPSSKNSSVVSDYVLAKFTEREMNRLEEESLPKIVEMLKKLTKEP